MAKYPAFREKFPDINIDELPLSVIHDINNAIKNIGKYDIDAQQAYFMTNNVRLHLTTAEPLFGDGWIKVDVDVNADLEDAIPSIPVQISKFGLMNQGEYYGEVKQQYIRPLEELLEESNHHVLVKLFPKVSAAIYGTNISYLKPTFVDRGHDKLKPHHYQFLKQLLTCYPNNCRVRLYVYRFLHDHINRYDPYKTICTKEYFKEISDFLKQTQIQIQNQQAGEVGVGSEVGDSKVKMLMNLFLADCLFQTETQGKKSIIIYLEAHGFFPFDFNSLDDFDESKITSGVKYMQNDFTNI